MPFDRSSPSSKNFLNKKVHVHADIDECLDGNHNCSEYADCENTHGGFNCKCYTGYEGDGVICQSKIVSPSTLI